MITVEIGPEAPLRSGDLDLSTEAAGLLISEGFARLNITGDAVLDRTCPIAAWSTAAADPLASRARNSQPAEAVLSPRELEVLKRIAEGDSMKQAAKNIGVSIKTVETHRRNMMAKLDIRSVALLTKYAIREGLTSLEP